MCHRNWSPCNLRPISWLHQLDDFSKFVFADFKLTTQLSKSRYLGALFNSPNEATLCGVTRLTRAVIPSLKPTGGIIDFDLIAIIDRIATHREGLRRYTVSAMLRLLTHRRARDHLRQEK